MRFFSNDAKETNDGEPDRDDGEAAVPQQRIGSPWSDAPSDSSEASATATAADTSDGGHDGHDLGGPKPGPDDQLDLPLDEHDPQVEESTVTSPDASVPTDAEATGTDADTAIRDEGDFEDPQAVDPATDQPLDAGTDAIDTHPTDRDAADTDTAESDATDTDPTDPATVVDTPVAATPIESDSDSTTYAGAASADATDHDDTPAEDPTPADTSESTAAVAAVPVAVAAADSIPTRTAKPGGVPEKGLDSLFAYSDAQAFRDRWRDVQLRFVDSPKDATAEAAALVDEAVDILTAGLKAQKDSLLSDSDDTEKLRLELRGYRDILNKVLGL